MAAPTTSGFARYTALAPDDDLVAALERQRVEFAAALAPIPEAESTVLHPPFTWTLRQVLGHLTDGERIFGYRALRFARGDQTPLPGFDENAYVEGGDFNARPLADLAAEFDAVRRSHVTLFRHLPPAAWSRVGTANGTPLSVTDLARVLVGHVRHHAAIIAKRLAGLELYPEDQIKKSKGVTDGI